MTKRKYKQKIARSKVIEMRKRGWRVEFQAMETESKVVDELAGDVWDHFSYKNKVGYLLIDPEGYVVSPKPRRYASEAWDDILGESDD